MSDHVISVADMAAEHNRHRAEGPVPPTRRQRRARSRAVVDARVPVRGTAYAASQCRCGETFLAPTSRQAIARRREHEADAGHDR